VKLNDAVWGVLLLALAAAVLWSTRSFPNIPGQTIGPSAFPALLAWILAGCAVALIVRGIRERAPAIELGEWLSSPSHIVNLLLTIAGLVFYIVAADRLGYLITAVTILLVLLLKLGVKARVAVPTAIAVVFVIHLVFYKVLRVTLPWGVLPVLY
jgi:putative tricarboxylic transport membrane protein